MLRSFDSIAQQVEQTGFSITDDFLPLSVSSQLLKECQDLFFEGEFQQAKIGKGIAEKKITAVRGDKIYWLEQNDLSASQRMFWQQIDTLRDAMSAYFRIRLPWFETHFALYPIGSFYKKHLDQFRITNNRIISFVFYLNPNWLPNEEGALRVYVNGGYQDILPELGRLVCFRSDILEHEVLPTLRVRHSLTGWMRRDEVPIIII